MSRPAPRNEFDLKPLHTFGLQAYASQLRFVQNHGDLLEYAAQIQQDLPAYLVGEGSNTVFVTPELRATVWKMALLGKKYLGIQKNCHIFRVRAGENWHALVEWTLVNGYPGLENLALIPGSVGASPVQNIGADGVELKDRIAGVHLLDVHTLKTQYLSTAECGFAYRDSLFKQELKGRAVIIDVDFALPVHWQPVLEYGDIRSRIPDAKRCKPWNVMQAIVSTRCEKLPDPVVLGNSGSFFKNPVVDSRLAQKLLQHYPHMPNFQANGGHVKLAAGWLIDQCGLKSLQMGDVQVYPKQALN